MAEMQSVGHQYLGQLLSKSIEYINNYRIQPGYDQVQYFYRCKDVGYFKTVAENNNIIVPIMKDNNGDPRSPINEQIAGVFLGVWLFDGGLPTASPFGNTRVSFPIEAIFTAGTNLYFTDFYCFYASRHQYLGQLLTKSIEYINNYRIQPGYDQVQYFYRCKDEEYFNTVAINNNIIVPIMKDNNGDPRSPINEQIAGVFLGVWLFNGGLPTASPFGNTRVSFPIEAILTAGTNLYFTDFYCFYASSYHYVTLVLTKEGSASDEFCRSSLLKLDQVNNPFMWRSGNGFNVVKADNLIVEIFYTESVDLNALPLEFCTIGVIGRGSSTPGGLPKNPNCLHCNPPSTTQVTIPP